MRNANDCRAKWINFPNGYLLLAQIGTCDILLHGKWIFIRHLCLRIRMDPTRIVYQRDIFGRLRRPSYDRSRLTIV